MLSVFPGLDFSVCIVFVYFHCLHYIPISCVVKAKFPN